MKRKFILSALRSLTVAALIPSAMAAMLALAHFGQQPTASSKVKVFRFGRLIGGKGKVWADAVVVVNGDRIRAVTSGDASVPQDAEVVDLRPCTAVPGLIDVHTHMTYYWDQAPGTWPWEQAGSRAPQMTVFLAQENARKTLESGVTTVRDLGASDYNDIAMRDLINRGAMSGPRMFVAGYGLHVTGRAPRPGYSSPSGGTADGLEAVMRVTREQIAAGADWIKMFASTGTGFDVSGHQTFTFEEMKAAVEVAHNRGKKIAIHSLGPSGARDAVRAGADSVEHAVDLDDATLAEMARRGTFYVPTVDHNRYYIDAREQFGYSARDVSTVEDYIRRNLETVRRAHKAGVEIAMGSDAVFTMFGQNARELGWFVKAGMTPEQALATATTNAAALLGMEKDLGAIAPGYCADMVAIEGDPLADIHAVIEGVRSVIKGGVLVVNRGCGQRPQ